PKRQPQAPGDRGGHEQESHTRSDVRDRSRVAGYIFVLRFASMASRNCSVVSHGALASIRIARSLVILPDSTVSTQTFSSASANFTTSGVLSNVPRYLRPCVQAKIEAIGLVEVGRPFWCSR